MTRFSLWALLAGAVLATAAAITTAVTLSGSGDEDAGRDQSKIVTQQPEVVLAPSGLPVGLLESKVTRTGGDVDVSNIRLLVRADGTGAYSPGGGGHPDGGGGYEVVYSLDGPGRVVLEYDGIVCAHPRALILSFTVDGGL